MNSLVRIFKTISQLGYKSIYRLIQYRTGLLSGYYRWKTPVHSLRPSYSINVDPVNRIFCSTVIVNSLNELGLKNSLVEAADNICRCRYRRFGGDFVPLTLVPKGELHHWTIYEMGIRLVPEDIKFLWEPARFGWVFQLGAAYIIQPDEKYARYFWESFETFTHANPPNLGPNWISAQEIAFRILAFAYGISVFYNSPQTTSERIGLLSASISAHASRIPLTLSYALAQNNNHILVEAAGLVTAAAVLPEHPASITWRKTGWNLANKALQTQFSPDGEYVQHSTNYHRLMLQASLWLHGMRIFSDFGFSDKALHNLALSVLWLANLIDMSSGKAPNFGHNDGSNLFPEVGGRQEDYRPIIQAASEVFLQRKMLPVGPWDSLAKLLNLSQPSSDTFASSPYITTLEFQQYRMLGDSYSRIYFRAAQYSSRPAHADQLHVDLWWQDANITLDAGSYLYNGDPPWNNSLASSLVHNTITLNDLDQMTRAGKFLWLDWANAVWIKTGEINSLSAEHNGYQSRNFTHRRTVVRMNQNHWQVRDEIIYRNQNDGKLEAALHWLVPDLPFELKGNSLEFTHPKGRITLCMESRPNVNSRIQIIRAGRNLSSLDAVSEIFGWHSPTYARKEPALSIRYLFSPSADIQVYSYWLFKPSAQ